MQNVIAVWRHQNQFKREREREKEGDTESHQLYVGGKNTARRSRGAQESVAMSE